MPQGEARLLEGDTIWGRDREYLCRETEMLENPLHPYRRLIQGI